MLLPLAWLGVLAVRTPGSALVRAGNVLGCLSLVAFLFFAGAGWAALGWYTRWCLVALALPLAVVAAARARGVPLLPRGLGGWAAALVTSGALLLASSALPALAEPGSSAPAVALQSPLGAGTYLVMQGGNSAILNHHAVVPAQRHALDIVGLNGAGFRAAGLSPSALSAYVIYGAPVLAPCSGEVLMARDGLPELPIGLPGEAGQRAPLGNGVLLYCESDVTVVLAHLQPSSVRVTAGERVAAGRVLGAVGNSGNTSEPHLHLHAVRGRVADAARALWSAEAVPLCIDGRSPVRNERLVVSDSAQQPGASS